MFKVRDIDHLDIDNFVLNVCTDLPTESFLYKLANELTNNNRSYISFITFLISIFYRAGIIGVIPDAFNEIQWAFREKTSISDGQINDGTALHIHPMVWRALGIHAAMRN